MQQFTASLSVTRYTLIVFAEISSVKGSSQQHDAKTQLFSKVS